MLRLLQSCAPVQSHALTPARELLDRSRSGRWRWGELVFNRKLRAPWEGESPPRFAISPRYCSITLPSYNATVIQRYRHTRTVAILNSGRLANWHSVLRMILNKGPIGGAAPFSRHAMRKGCHFWQPIRSRPTQSRSLIIRVPIGGVGSFIVAANDARSASSMARSSGWQRSMATGPEPSQTVVRG